MLALNCHCRDYQRASGSAFAAVLIVPASPFSLTKGTPIYYAVTADSGNTMSRGFCRECGSPVVITHRRITPGPEVMVVYAASFDDTGATVLSTGTEHFAASNRGKQIDFVVTSLSSAVGAIGGFSISGTLLRH